MGEKGSAQTALGRSRKNAKEITKVSEAIKRPM